MSQKLQFILEDVGSKLQNPPANKDALIKLLKQAAASLSELEQSPAKEVLKSMQPFVNAIVKPELLKHHDKEVKLLVAACTCEITRVTAPEAPYDDGVLKDIFHLIVSTFSGLRDTKGPSYGRRVTILETVAKYRSCIVMLDLECDDLINEMFTTFFAVASDGHSDSVITSMKTIMVVLLEESEDINQDLLLIILSVLGRDKKAITMSARKLAMNVIGQCAGKLEPGIKHFIVKSMSGEETSSAIYQINHHEIIYDIYRCAPQALAGIIPYLSGELLTDKLGVRLKAVKLAGNLLSIAGCSIPDTFHPIFLDFLKWLTDRVVETDKLDIRLKAVKLAGDLFSIPGCSIPDTFHPIFLDFLKRLTDRVVEVRMSVLEHVKRCMLSNPSRSESPQLIAALCDRLLDYDESIRQKVVEVVSDVACHELSSISPNTLKLVADRLRDKSLLVKKYTMERLSDIYRTCCTKHMSDGYIWIPGRILRCFYDKDFRSDTVEYILCTSLFPVELSVKDKFRMWVRLFSKFDKVEIKALEKILEQKQRLQLELQKYLSLRKMYKESDALELKKKVMICFRFMSHCFTDFTKAESDFLLLHQLKDANVWKILTTLLDPTTSSLRSSKSRDELLKIVGQKHPLYGFLSILSMKCSYILFNKDYVKDILLEMDLQKSASNRLLTQSCMNILVILASFSPLLLSGTEKDLVHLLEDDNEIIKQGVLHVLAKAGGVIRKQLGESSSTLDLFLERTCLEGSRRLAKYAVHALAAITKDDGLKSLSVLYKKLVDMLEKKTHLPSVLQSLGCIAQIAIPVFETQETKIQNFIKKDILGRSEKASGKTKESWDDRTELSSLKIFGIKILVKSYLPVKDAHLRVGVGELIKDLNNILSFGEISKDIESSRVDKAHLKLASAKAILRLSRHWDNKIPIDVFYLTLRTSEFGFPEVRRLFLNKVHRYIKDRSLDPKYACAFLLDFGSHQSVQKEKSEENSNLNDIIQMCQQGKARQVSVQGDGNFSVVHPEYILPYLIHALAHHPSFPNIDECKDLKRYEPIYRKLYFFLSMLAHGDENEKPGNTLKKEEVISVLSIIGSIRSSEDALDTNMSKNLYAICDLCFLVTKRLAQKQEDFEEPLVHVRVPEGLYVSHDKKEEKETEEDKKEENETGNDKKEENETGNDKKEEEETEKDEKEENEKEDKKHGTEGQTWLGEASVVAHFESLNMEANESAASIITEDDMLKDIEDTDGNEVPLGKILERLKARGTKERKLVKNGSTPPAVQNNSNKENNNNVDILDMATEIDLDILGVSNGHEVTKSDVNHKRKRIPNQTVSVSVAKRQKSKVLSVFDDIKMSDLEDALDLEDDIHTKEHGNTDVSDLENPKKHVNTDVNNYKSGSVRKRKTASVAGLAKCTSKEGGSQHTTDLIGRRIKVWWPKDKEFYEGLVKSYDHEKKRHVVLYNDGDVEVLHLDKERWVLVKNSPNFAKRNKSSKSPRPRKGSSKKKNKMDNSKGNKESSDIYSSSMVRGKRTPRKNTKERRKKLEYLEVERTEDLDDITESEHEHEDLTFSKVDTLDSEEEEDASDRERTKDAAENRFSDAESVENESENVADVSGSVQEDDDGAELSDDMPLGVWKSQVRKADESK